MQEQDEEAERLAIAQAVAARAQLPPMEQLYDFLATASDELIEHFIARDVTDTGTISRAAFVAARPHFGDIAKAVTRDDLRCPSPVARLLARL